eukprot:TRINITY_DN38573_c0_g1_i1.p1 TRINITY_DN38573_c0_g1~~TRINITY_DN38573_c0_g1_i1.p1  ORF type:complete len:224 (+),score=17.54 TRINITY_DN38573_c0_g1_i1:101-772(+)
MTAAHSGESRASGVIRRRPQPLGADAFGATERQGCRQTAFSVTVKNTFLELSPGTDGEDDHPACQARGASTAPASMHPVGTMKLALEAATYSTTDKDEDETPTTMTQSPPVTLSGDFGCWPPTPTTPHVPITISLAALTGANSSSGSTVLSCGKHAPVPKFAPPSEAAPVAKFQRSIGCEGSLDPPSEEPKALRTSTARPNPRRRRRRWLAASAAMSESANEV